MHRLSLLAIIFVLACTPQTHTSMKTDNTPLFGLGDPVSANFTGEAWLQMLSAEPAYDCQIYNVTFAPATRNFWHRHSVGQILLCTQGEGYYQQQGQPARRLTVGSVVQIPADAVHWHGAAPHSQFTHIGITPRVSENKVEWLGEVTEAQYMEATKNQVNENTKNR